MRPDMHKVICERPRPGSRYDNPKRDPYRRTDLEDLPTKESMKERHMDRRHFNENLQPLQRWLKSKVGQPWDKVYSEACEVIKPTSTVKNHVKIHLKQMVVQDAVLVDGIPYRIAHWGNGYVEIGVGLWDELYVHPVTKMLCAHRQKKYKEKPKEITRYLLSSNKDKPNGVVIPSGFTPISFEDAIEKINGIWYNTKTMVGKTREYSKEARKFYTGHKEIYFKRQLNKKQLKQYNVVNDKE